MSYRIFTDATADLTPEMMAGLPNIEILPMEIGLGGRTYTYGPGGDISVEEFYAAQRAGQFAATTQIRPAVYLDAFGRCLHAGMDVLYLCFSSGMSGTYQTACLCAETLQQICPNGRVVCVDTLCASVGEGFLVQEAARRQAEGFGLDELAGWVKACRLQVCHWFTVDTFEHLRHGGRVSGTAAVMGTMLQIKPMLQVSRQGALEVIEKPRGSRHAMEALLRRMENGWDRQMEPSVVIGHGDCPDRAAQLRAMVEQRFPEAQISVAPIGPVIGAHTGPGMLAIVHFGAER